MSYDLMLHASLARATPDLLQELRRRVDASQTLLYCEPHFYDFSASYWGDPEDLEEIFSEAEASRPEYETFCQGHSLDPSSNYAVGFYLENLTGVSVLTIHLSSDPEFAQSVFTELGGIARELSLSLYDPQFGGELPSSYSALLPPNY